MILLNYKYYLKTILLFLSIGIGEKLYAQVDSNDTKKAKTSFGAVPILSYDTDLGLRYGAVINYFKYNDSVSENYSENIYLKVFNTTSKSFQIQSVYETDNLFKKSKVFIEGTYLNDKTYDFYGYNGHQSIYNPSFEDPLHQSFLHKNFYSINRELTRFRFDYQRHLTSPNLRILLGLTLNKLKIIQNQSDTNLYDFYNNLDLIQDDEIKGGTINYLSIGMVYEKRNNQIYCSKGKWFESFLVISPTLFSTEAFSKCVVSFRSYDQILKSKFILMTRASVQLRTSGIIPSYLKSTYFDTKLNQDGLGGAFNLRGFSRNRIVSEGFGLLNLEIRKNIYQTKFKKTIIDCDLSFFSDNALILQDHKIKKESISVQNQLKHFDFNLKYHYSTLGLGAYIILNRNNVISINYGVPLIPNTKGAIYIGSSFLF